MKQKGASPQPAQQHESTLVAKLRYRLYPTPGQQIALAQTFGCARVVWNDALALSNKLHGEGQKYPGGTAKGSGLQEVVSGLKVKLCVLQRWGISLSDGVAISPPNQAL